MIADLSTISYLNAKLIIPTLETEQLTFHKPQFTNILGTFMSTSVMKHFFVNVITKNYYKISDR